jgi:hypothetical protein
MILEIAAGPDGSTTELKLNAGGVNEMGGRYIELRAFCSLRTYCRNIFKSVARIEANSGPGSF